MSNVDAQRSVCLPDGTFFVCMRIIVQTAERTQILHTSCSIIWMRSNIAERTTARPECIENGIVVVCDLAANANVYLILMHIRNVRKCLSSK